MSTAHTPGGTNEWSPGVGNMVLQVGDWLRLSAARFPDRTCFDDTGEGRVLTFGETNSRVNRLASALAKRGVRRPDRVAVLGIDSHRYMETLLASMKLGTVFVPLNFRLAPFEVQNLVAASEARWIFVSERYVPLASELRDPSGAPLHVVCFDGPADGAIAFEHFLSEGDDVEPGVTIGDEDVLGLAFTSGTTGLPKGVLQSQRMIKRMVSSMMVDYGVLDGDCRYSAAPIFHISGMGMIFMGIARGYANVLAPQFDADKAIDWFLEDRLTAAFFVPTMISALLDHPRIREPRYTRLRTILYGASPMPPALLRRAMDVFGCDFVQAFGAGTEAGLQTVLTADDHRRAVAGEEHLLGSIGKAAYGVELRLCDDQLRDVPLGQVGEIVTRSEMVMSGYLRQPEATADAIVDGWFRAGDLAWMDAEGYLYLGGRRKDMIIRGGENVYPVEIEAVLAEHPALLDVAVVGHPDAHWGEVVVAFATLRSGATAPTYDEIRAHCRAKLAGYKVPEHFYVVDEFPKNSTGKILKRELREWEGGRPPGYGS